MCFQKTLPERPTGHDLTKKLDKTGHWMPEEAIVKPQVSWGGTWSEWIFSVKKCCFFPMVRHMELGSTILGRRIPVANASL